MSTTIPKNDSIVHICPVTASFRTFGFLHNVSLAASRGLSERPRYSRGCSIVHHLDSGGDPEKRHCRGHALVSTLHELQRSDGGIFPASMKLSCVSP